MSLPRNLAFATLCLFLLIFTGFLFVTEKISRLLLSLLRFCISNSHPISLPLSHGACPRDHCDLLLVNIHSLTRNCNGKVGPSLFHCEQIRQVILESPAKTCSLDPLPTNILRRVVNDLEQFIWIMCNASIREGHLPVSQKAALIMPVLKKPTLDPDDAKSYRPISNLTFISKMIERLVAQQINDHLKECGLLPWLQSAYRRGHSNESALLRVISDVLAAANVGLVSRIGLLDLSAASDTVDHDILIHRLQTSYGVTGRTLEWLRSFLSDRTQTVTFRGVTSVEARLTCSVPQG